MLLSSALCFSVAAEGEQGWETTLAPDTQLFAVELSEEIARGLEMASVIWDLGWKTAAGVRSCPGAIRR